MPTEADGHQSGRGREHHLPGAPEGESIRTSISDPRLQGYKPVHCCGFKPPSWFAEATDTEPLALKRSHHGRGPRLAPAEMKTAAGFTLLRQIRSGQN